ncbi:MAG TPA: DUF1800 domain-containing protein [Casimicrobiaceae bacterium]|nr:DUF1800 domain-containing protein [Casimicrobiaceae bacterium]
MRLLLALLALTLASACYAAAPAGAPVLGYDDARHLLARTGFGPTQAEIERYASMTREQAVRKLLAEARTTAVTPPPAWTSDYSALASRPGAAASEMEKKLFQQEQVRNGLELRGWWVAEMLNTPSPLTERMTLFWHNHFVSSQQKVKLAQLMYRQNVTLRANALGNLGAMLHAIARDPAMVIYLDSAQNRKGTPNENFAREAMELFTLGEGSYSEQDIKEAARAFTGWSLDRKTGEFMFRPFIHDYGAKAVLGRAGDFDGDQVLDILLAQAQTAEFITRKLWREFVSPDPDAAEVGRIAKRFRESHYDIKVALHGLLTSDAFYAPGNRGALIKSPVDLVVGTLRQFELKPAEPIAFAVAAAGMGQNLFSPPNVKGWPGQEAWINSTTLLARKAFLDRVFRSADAIPMIAAPDERTMQPPRQAIAPAGAQDPDKMRQLQFMKAMDRGISTLQFDGGTWLAQFQSAGNATARTDAVTRLLLAAAPQSPPDPRDGPIALVRGIVLDASYQLK